jgi:hypothetical protein
MTSNQFAELSCGVMQGWIVLAFIDYLGPLLQYKNAVPNSTIVSGVTAVELLVALLI